MKKGKDKKFPNGYEIAEMVGCGKIYYKSAINKIMKETAGLDKKALYEYQHKWEEMFGLQSDEQAALVLKIQSGDEAAKRKLMLACVPLVIMVAQQYCNSSVSIPDLIREGLGGAQKAAGRFDVQRGFKFSSYAVWWIRKHMLDEIGKRKKKNTGNNEVEIYNRYQFCEMVSDFYQYLIWEEPNDVFLWVDIMEKKHQLAMAPHLKSLGLNAQERTLFYLICHDFKSKETHDTALSDRLGNVYRKEKERLGIMDTFRAGEHPLQVQSFVEVREEQGNIVVTLTEKGQRLFLDEDYGKM